METINCTAVIHVQESKNINYIIIRILDHDGPSLPKSDSSSYNGENRFYPLHMKYAQACKLQLDKKYLCNFTLEFSPKFAHPTIRLSNIDQLSPLQANKTIRELKEG